MCNNNNREQENSGIAEILKVIQLLQQHACPENNLDSCDRPMLGGGTSCLVCNTRPVMLYTCCGNGVPISMPTSKDATCTCSNSSLDSSCASCSNVFRVEKVENDCCTFRVLIENPDQTCCNREPYLATNSFFTMSFNCLCILRCLNDCYVDGVC